LLHAPVADRQRGPHCPLRVVLVRSRRAEDRHHRIADELLDRAATPLELLPHVSVIGREQSADVLGIESLGLRGEPNEVDEHDRDGLAFLSEQALLRLERPRARVAETRPFRVLLTTARTRHHG
jgi:hypothetical protein